ncbi:MAG: DNA polymerase III subunit delta [Oscillospiraceae bacterium]|nr:DNA polymerase III subunit delta [Oscillospiraceae bacterium]
MAVGYKITDKDFRRLWFVLSKDSFVCSENLTVIEQICRKNGIDDDSISYFSVGKIDWDEIYDLVLTPSFFGERLIVIKDGDITSINDDDFAKLEQLIEECDGNRLAVVLTYEDDKKLKAKKYDRLFEKVKKHGLLHYVQEINERYLEEMIVSHAKKQGTELPKEVSRKIVENIGKDVGLLINEVDKYCAASDYSQITMDIVDRLGVKTVEASVFDMIDLICRKKPVKAIEKLNNLFDLRTDEIAILGAMTSSFVDMHRCKMAQAQRKDYMTVQKDFEKNANSYRYKKAMNNAQNFSLSALEEILRLLMKSDIAMKSTAQDKKQMLYVLTTQIIAKGVR